MCSIKLSEGTLKFDNIVASEKEFHAFKQAIGLNLVDTNKIVILTNLSLVIMALNILLATKMMVLFNRYALFCLKWVDAQNVLKKGEKHVLHS